MNQELRDKFNDFKSQPSEDLSWEKMEHGIAQNLSKEKKRKKRPLFILFLGISSIVALLGITYYLSSIERPKQMNDAISNQDEIHYSQSKDQTIDGTNLLSKEDFHPNLKDVETNSARNKAVLMSNAHLSSSSMVDESVDDVPLSKPARVISFTSKDNPNRAENSLIRENSSPNTIPQVETELPNLKTTPQLQPQKEKTTQGIKYDIPFIQTTKTDSLISMHYEYTQMTYIPTCFTTTIPWTFKEKFQFLNFNFSAGYGISHISLADNFFHANDIIGSSYAFNLELNNGLNYFVRTGIERSVNYVETSFLDIQQLRRSADGVIDTIYSFSDGTVVNQFADSVNVIATRDFRNTSTLKSINIPISLGYKIKRAKTQIGFYAGATLHLKSEFQGILADESKNTYETRVVNTINSPSFHFGIQLEKRIQRRLNIVANTRLDRIRFDNNRFKNSNAYHLRLGIQYRL